MDSCQSTSNENAANCRNATPSSSDRPATFHAPSRDTARKVEAYIAQKPFLRARYVRAKEFRRILRQVSNFDLTSRCNLFCEGCFYFEGEDYKRAKEQNDLDQWREFFREQARRGITFASLAGAEPALEQ